VSRSCASLNCLAHRAPEAGPDADTRPHFPDGGSLVLIHVPRLPRISQTELPFRPVPAGPRPRQRVSLPPGPSLHRARATRWRPLWTRTINRPYPLVPRPAVNRMSAESQAAVVRLRHDPRGSVVESVSGWPESLSS
jgi:hypothetical protein